jgi:hypothetical protein
MTLDDAIGVLRHLPHTAPLDLRQIAAIRTVCAALTAPPAPPSTPPLSRPSE